MCQAIVFLREDGEDTEVMRDVSMLERVEGGIKLQTIFGEPQTFDARILRVDLLKGRVVLEPREE
jgi:predicted RNA-binding protein